MSNYDLPTPEFSDDPQENLRIENEIIKLKLSAEFGAVHNGSENIPPAMEHFFLQQIERFEKEWHKQQLDFIRIYDFLGRPKFIDPKDLKPTHVAIQLNRILKLLQEKNINVYFIRDYHPLLKYKFLTEELFQHEMENISMPGWNMNFIYEEFRPEQ